MALAAVGIGWCARRPVVLVLAVGVLTSTLGARAWAGLDPPPRDTFSGRVTVLSDPEDVNGAVRVDVRVGRRRVEAWARGSAAASLRPRLAGERVTLQGRLGPVPERSREWLGRRHISGRLSVEKVFDWSVGDPASRLANGVRRTLIAGSEPMAPEQRALFAGLVLGDDRDQSPETADAFRGAGLTHLLVVSGQNVAFVLALAAPALSRLPLRARLVATVAVIAFFALLTRFEPSVLRASALAGVAAAATTWGRPSSRVRLLALAVTGLLVVDPLLVGSVGFLLSVGASAGITVLARPLADRLPGPRPLASALAVTVAAQVGVAPVLVPVFGGMPLASVPANLLAVPAAGPVMMWGLTAGLVAGLAGPPWPSLLHLPTSWLLGWVAAVADWGASLALPQIGPTQAVLLGVTGTAAALVRRPGLRRVAAVALVASIVVPVVRPPSGPDVDRALADGAWLWRSGGAVVVVIDAPDPLRLLDALRRRGVRHVDVLVARRGSRPAATTVLAVRRRLPVGLLLAPHDHRIRHAVTPTVGSRVMLGGLTVTVDVVRPRLEVEVEVEVAVGRPGDASERPR